MTRKWRPGERGRIWRKWCAGESYTEMGISDEDMRYIMNYMRRVAPFKRPK